MTQISYDTIKTANKNQEFLNRLIIFYRECQ